MNESTKARTLACYLLREDGEWYDFIDDVHRWRTSFAVFPGPPDGSVMLTQKDARVLALRLDDYGHDLPTRERFATNIIKWSAGKSIRFVTELDPEVEPDVAPTPITGRLPV